jgi:uncharacterized membrane protein YfhO
VLVAESPNQLVIQTESESSGWLVLVDTWYPGWKAWVDGERLSVRRANGVFRAVQLPAGKHGVYFRYVPMEFILGISISLLTLLVMVFLQKKCFAQMSRFGVLFLLYLKP